MTTEQAVSNTKCPKLDVSKFDRVVNAVNDLGWDNSGSESIGSPAESGLLIKVPPGEYKYPDSGYRYGSKLKNFAIVGCYADGTLPQTDEEKAEVMKKVTFTVNKGSVVRILDIRDGYNVQLRNFIVDIKDDWETAAGVALLGGAFITDYFQFRGWRPDENQGSTGGLAVYNSQEYKEESTYISNYYVDERVSLVDYPKNVVSFGSYSPSYGTIYLLDSTFENCGEHGVYASRIEGDVRMERCLFKNNQNTQARISGDGSYAKDCVFIWDDSSPNEGTFQAKTGLVFESGFQGYSGGLVENCDFICKSNVANSGCLKVDGSQGAVTVKDCKFHVTQNVPPFNVEAPGDSHMIDGTPDKPWGVNVRNCHFIGEGKSRWNYDSEVRFDKRGMSELTGLEIDARGSRHGIRLLNDDYKLSDSNISSTRERITTTNATVSTTNVGANASPEFPSSRVPEVGGEEQVQETESTPPSYPNVLRVTASDSQTVGYTVNVSGDSVLVTEGDYNANPRQKEGDMGEWVERHDDASSTINGYAANRGSDSFEFEGKITNFEWEGPKPKVLLNGEEVDPASFEPPTLLKEATQEELKQFLEATTVDDATQEQLLAPLEDASLVEELKSRGIVQAVEGVYKLQY